MHCCTYKSRQKAKISLKTVVKICLQDQQGKVVFNERNPHTTQQQELVAGSPGGPQTETGQGKSQSFPCMIFNRIQFCENNFYEGKELCLRSRMRLLIFFSVRLNKKNILASFLTALEILYPDYF
jgi:hypothetical protein